MFGHPQSCREGFRGHRDLPPSRSGTYLDLLRTHLSWSRIAARRVLSRPRHRIARAGFSRLVMFPRPHPIFRVKLTREQFFLGLANGAHFRNLPIWPLPSGARIVVRTQPRTPALVRKKHLGSAQTSYLAIADGSVGVGALPPPPEPELSTGSRDLVTRSQLGPD